MLIFGLEKELAVLTGSGALGKMPFDETSASGHVAKASLGFKDVAKIDDWSFPAKSIERCADGLPSESIPSKRSEVLYTSYL